MYVVDRVNQIAMATSMTGPEDLLKTLAKASIALLALFPVFEFIFGPAIGPTVSHFCVHAGLGVLAKYLLQMSVFASIVQALVPFWDPNHKARSALIRGGVDCCSCCDCCCWDTHTFSKDTLSIGAEEDTNGDALKEAAGLDCVEDEDDARMLMQEVGNGFTEE